MGLIGGGAVVLALLLLLLARRRKAQQEAEKHLRMARALSEGQDFSFDSDLPESSFDGLEVPASERKTRHCADPRSCARASGGDCASCGHCANSGTAGFACRRA